MEAGPFTVGPKKVEDTRGWLPWRRRHRQDVERARGKLGIVEIALDERAGLVSRDNWGLGVLSNRRQSNYENVVNASLHHIPS